jgi:hypothetical protein
MTSLEQAFKAYVADYNHGKTLEELAKTFDDNLVLVSSTCLLGDSMYNHLYDTDEEFAKAHDYILSVCDGDFDTRPESTFVNNLSLYYTLLEYQDETFDTSYTVVMHRH